MAKINEGWLDFDVAIATTEAMKQVRTLARVLGPKGLMPNPKTGTVSLDIAKAVREIKAGKVEFRSDDGGATWKLVFTNTVPVEAYRGAGRPEAAYVVERVVDAAGRTLQLPPRTPAKQVLTPELAGELLGLVEQPFARRCRTGGRVSPRAGGGRWSG